MTKPPSDQDILAMMDEDIGILVLVQGSLPDGSDHYAYASIKPSLYQAFKAAEAKGNYDLGQFGKILAHGKGKEPPADVVERMKNEHGANHRFEEELTQWVDELKRQLPAAT